MLHQDDQTPEDSWKSLAASQKQNIESRSPTINLYKEVFHKEALCDVTKATDTTSRSKKSHLLVKQSNFFGASSVSAASSSASLSFSLRPAVLLLSFSCLSLQLPLPYAMPSGKVTYCKPHSLVKFLANFKVGPCVCIRHARTY